MDVTLTRYFTKLLTANVAAVAMVLVLVLVGGRFLKYMEQAAEGLLSIHVLFDVILFRMPSFLELIFPLSLFLGIILCYGKLYVEHEIPVCVACGVSPSGLVRYTTPVIIMVAAIVAMMSMWLTPLGMQKVDRIFHEQRHKSNVDTFSPGKFHVSSNQKNISYTQAVDDNTHTMQNLMIIEKDKSQMQILLAASGGRTLNSEGNTTAVTLEDGVRYIIKPWTTDLERISFMKSTHFISGHKVSPVVQKIQSLTTYELWQDGSDFALAQLQWRVSMPLLCIVMALVAVPLAHVRPRQGRYFKLLPALMLFMVYVSMLTTAKSWMEEGKLNPEVGLWIVHAFFVCIMVFMNRSMFHRVAFREISHVSSENVSMRNGSSGGVA